MSQENDYIEEEVFEAEDQDFDNQPEEVDTDTGEEEIDWKARALKAEQAIIKNKTKNPVKKEKSSNDDSKIEFQKLLLEDKGFNEDDIELAEKIAKLEGISLLKATQNDIFVSLKSKQKQEEVSQQASAGTSRRGRVMKRDIEDIKREAKEGKPLSREDRLKVIKSRYAK